MGGKSHPSHITQHVGCKSSKAQSKEISAQVLEMGSIDPKVLALFKKPNSEIQPLHCSPKRTIEITEITITLHIFIGERIVDVGKRFLPKILNTAMIWLIMMKYE